MAIRDRDEALQAMFAAKRAGQGSIYGGPPMPAPQQAPQQAPQPQQPQGGGGGYQSLADQLGQKKESGGGGLNPFADGFGTALKNGLGTVLGGATKVLEPVSNSILLGLEEGAEALQGGKELAYKFDEYGNKTDTRSNWEKLNDPHYGVGQIMGDTFGDSEKSEWSKWANRSLGFVGDVATDPLTYIGGGAAKSVAAVGKTGRSSLAKKASELGLSDEIIDSVARYGPAFQTDETRRLLNVKDAGVYMGVGQSSFKIPGSTMLGRGAEKTFAKVRDTTFGNAGRFRNSGRVGEAAAKRATQTGRTVDGWTPAMGAKFLQNVDVWQASHGRYRDTYSREAQKMMSGWSDKTRTGVTHTIESAPKDAAGKIVGPLPQEAVDFIAFKNKLRQFAVDNDVNIGDLGETYMPHRGTKQGNEWLARNKPEAFALFQDLTDGAAATKTRKIGPNTTIEVHGQKLEFTTGTIDDIEKQFQKAFPEAGVDKFVEDNAARLMERYVDEIAQSVASVDMIKGAVARGHIGDLKAYSTEMVASARTATKNAEMKEMLGKELARRDKELGEAQEKAWALGQDLAEALHRAADDEFRAAGDAADALKDELKVIRKELLSADGDREKIANQFATMKANARDAHDAAGKQVDTTEQSLAALRMDMASADYGVGLSVQKQAALRERHAAQLARLEDQKAIMDETLHDTWKAIKWAEKVENSVAAQLAVADAMEEAADSPDVMALLTYQSAADGVIQVERDVVEELAPYSSPVVEALEAKLAQRQLDETIAEAAGRSSTPFDAAEVVVEATGEARKAAWAADHEVAAQAYDVSVKARQKTVVETEAELASVSAKSDEWNASLVRDRPRQASKEQVAEWRRTERSLRDKLERREAKRQSQNVQLANVEKLADLDRQLDELGDALDAYVEMPLGAEFAPRLLQDGYNPPKVPLNPTRSEKLNPGAEAARQRAAVVEGWDEATDPVVQANILMNKINEQMVDVQDRLTAASNRMLDEFSDAGWEANEIMMNRWRRAKPGTPEPEWEHGAFTATARKMEEEMVETWAEMQKLTAMRNRNKAYLDRVGKNPYEEQKQFFIERLMEQRSALRADQDAARRLRRNKTKLPQETGGVTSSEELELILSKVKRIEGHGAARARIIGKSLEDVAAPKTMNDPRAIAARIEKVEAELAEELRDATDLRVPLAMHPITDGRGRPLRSLARVDDEEAEVLGGYMRDLRGTVERDEAGEIVGGGGYAYHQAIEDDLKYKIKVEKTRMARGVVDGEDRLRPNKVGNNRVLSDYEEQEATLKALRTKEASHETLSTDEHALLHGVYDKKTKQWVKPKRLAKPDDFDAGIFPSTPAGGVDDIDDYLARQVNRSSQPGRNVDTTVQSDTIRNDPAFWADQADEDLMRQARRDAEERWASTGNVNDDVADELGYAQGSASADELAYDGATTEPLRIHTLQEELKEAAKETRRAKRAYDSALKQLGVSDAAMHRAAPDGVIGNILLFHPSAAAERASGKKLSWIKDSLFETPQGLRDSVRSKYKNNWAQAVKDNPKLNLNGRKGRGGKPIGGFDKLTHVQAAQMMGGDAQLRRMGKQNWNALPQSMRDRAVNNQFKEVLRNMDPRMRMRVRHEAYGAAKHAEASRAARAKGMMVELEDLHVQAQALDDTRDRLLQAAATRRAVASEELAESANAAARQAINEHRAKGALFNIEGGEAEAAMTKRLIDNVPEEAQAAGLKAMDADIKLADELEDQVVKLKQGASARQKTVEVIGKTETARLASFDAAVSVKQAKLDSAEETFEKLAERQAAVKDMKDRLKTRIGQDKKKTGTITDEQLAARLDEYGALLDEAAKNPQDLDLVAAATIYDDWMKLTTKMDRMRQGSDDLFDVYDAAKRGAKGKEGGLALEMQQGLRDGFVRFRSELYDGANDAPIDGELFTRLTNFMKATEIDKEMKWLDAGTRFFKSYATSTPGFHFRNWMGATFVNFSDDVSAKASVKSLGLWRGYAKDPENFLKTQPKQVRDAFDAVFGAGAGGSFMVGEIGSGLSRAKNAATSNAWLRKSRAIGEDFVEGPVRLAAALDTTMKGGSMSDAMGRVARLHFDYADLSNFDKKMKRIIPFWVFMSRNLPLQVEQMWRKPKAYSVYRHFMNNVSDEEEGVDEFMPDWMKRAGGTVVARGSGGFGSMFTGGKDTVLMPDMQHVGLQEDIEAFGGSFDGEGRYPIIDGLLSAGNPLVTKPIEVLANRSGFRGDKAFYGTKKDDLGNRVDKSAAEQALERVLYGAEGIFAPLGAAQGLSGTSILGGSESERLQDRMVQKAYNYFGIPVKQLGERERTAEALRREFED